jgi:hypothetical protein
LGHDEPNAVIVSVSVVMVTMTTGTVMVTVMVMTMSLRAVTHSAHQQAGAERSDQQPTRHAEPGQHHFAGQCC